MRFAKCLSHIPTWILLCLCSLAAHAQPPCSFAIPRAVPEVSGLAVQAGACWWHNDSGHAPYLYRTDSKGHLLDSLTHPLLVNRDWEDLAQDEEGNLYIGDFGNNCRCRADLTIYRYNLSGNRVDSLRFALPGPPADMEAFVWWDDSLHLFSKEFGRTVRYVLPDEPGTYTALPRDTLPLPKRSVTAAALLPDGSTLALLSYGFPKMGASVFFIPAFAENGLNAGVGKKKGILPKQYESADFWNEKYLLIATEKRWPFRAKARRMRVPKDLATTK